MAVEVCQNQQSNNELYLPLPVFGAIFYTRDQKLCIEINEKTPDKDCPQPMTPVNAVQREGQVNRNKTFNLKLVYLNIQCLRSKLNLVSAFLEKGQPDFFL